MVSSEQSVDPTLSYDWLSMPRYYTNTEDIAKYIRSRLFSLVLRISRPVYYVSRGVRVYFRKKKNVIFEQKIYAGRVTGLIRLFNWPPEGKPPVSQAVVLFVCYVSAYKVVACRKKKNQWKTRRTRRGGPDTRREALSLV